MELHSRSHLALLGFAICLLLAGCPRQALANTLAHTSPEAASGRGEFAAQSSPGSSGGTADELIRRVEQTYSSGLNHYNHGQLEAARRDFDAAVDLMLISPLDIQADPQLSAEFDKIVEGINTLEMAALRQGQGLVPQTEISPAEEANAVTFPVDPHIKATAEAELRTTSSDLPLVINDYVASYINYFSNSSAGRGHLVHSLERAGRYKEMILRILKEEGVPQDLIYQAIQESGFQTQAMNGRSGAGGMWQFMPFDSYGLTRNAWVDERFDPEKSTHAYARYIKTLYKQFGDWYLAMAAYDWGPGYVQRAVQKTGYADFWELYRRNVLPAETKNYVPIILAAIIMAKNPQQYGLMNLNALPPVAFDTVATHEETSLRLIADLVNAPLEEVVALNPGLLRLSTPGNGAYDLHLPPGTGDLYQSRLALIPAQKRNSWRYHIVLQEDTLPAIARQYHSDSSEIASVNQLNGGEITVGQGLLVPVVETSASSFTRESHYKVHHGDTLVSVADRFGISADQLRHWNHLQGNTVSAGQVLQVAVVTRRSARRSAPAHGRSSSSKPSNHATAAHSRSGTASKSGKRSGAAASSSKAASTSKKARTRAISH